MKITLSTSEIKTSLHTIIGVVEKKQTLPILSHVLFILENNTLTLCTTDMEIEIKAQTSVSSAEKTTFTLYAKTLLDIIRNLANETQIEFTLNEDKIILKTNGSQFTLNSLAAENFPALPKISDSHSLTLDKHSLKTLVEKTAFSIASQDIRTYLNGLLIKLSKDKLTLVATDGHKLAVASEALENKLTEDQSIILPKKTVLELQKLLSNELCGDVLNITLSEHYFIVSIDNQITLTSRLIDAQFPDYEQVIPKETTEPVVINRLSFLSCLQQAAVFMDDRTKGVRLIFDEKNLAINTHSEKGQANTGLTLSHAVNNKLEVGFNINYLISILERLTTEDIHFIMPDTNKSCLLTNSDTQSVKYVIMPLKL